MKGMSVPRYTNVELALILILTVDLLNIDLPFELSIIRGINSLYAILPVAIAFLALLKVMTGKVYIRPTLLSFSYSIFLGYVFLNSMLVSLRPEISIRYAMLMLMWFMAFQFFSQFRDIRINRVIYGYILVLTAYFVVSIVFNLVTLQPRLEGITMQGDASRMGLLAFFGLSATLYLSRIHYFEYRIVELLLVTVMAVSLIYSGSRTIYLIVAFMFPLALLGNRIYRPKELVLVGMTTTVVLGALFVLGIASGSEAISAQMEKLIGSVTGGSEIDKGRKIFFDFAVHVIRENPKILIAGIGLESYLTFESDLEAFVGRINVLHNMYLQYGLGLGFTGLAIFVAYLSALARSMRRIRDKTLRDFLIVLLLGCLVYGMFHPGIVSRGLLFLLPLIATLALRQSWRRERAEVNVQNSPVVSL